MLQSLRSLTIAAALSSAVVAGCSSHSGDGGSQPSIASVHLPYDTPLVFYVPTVVPSGLEVWTNPDKPGTFVLLAPGLSSLRHVRLSYQVDRVELAGQNLGSRMFSDALIHEFDDGTSLVWWRSESTYVVVTFSVDFTSADISQFVDGLESTDRGGWDEFAKSKKKLDQGSF